MGWMLRWAQQITGRVNTTLSFWLITLVYVILGLMEVDDLRRKAEAFVGPDEARALLSATEDTARKFRKYMIVRTQMSLATGLLVGAFACATGLQFAAEWGVIAFALNYIPFIGPFVATLFPTLLAMAQFATWQAVLGVFVCLNIIQFVIGSYVEPRVSGNVLSISPMVVLFAVFFWTFLWGLYGAFIGVPVTIAALTFCGHYPSTRWIADVFGGPAPETPLRACLARALGRDLHSLRCEQAQAAVRPGGERMDIEMRCFVGRSHHRRRRRDDPQAPAGPDPVDVAMAMHNHDAFRVGLQDPQKPAAVDERGADPLRERVDGHRVFCEVVVQRHDPPRFRMGVERRRQTQRLRRGD